MTARTAIWSLLISEEESCDREHSKKKEDISRVVNAKNRIKCNTDIQGGNRGVGQIRFISVA